MFTMHGNINVKKKNLPLSYQGYFPGEKRPGSDVEHSIPLGVEVKNEWLYNSSLPICVNKDNFTVLLGNPSPNSHIFVYATAITNAIAMLCTV